MDIADKARFSWVFLISLVVSHVMAGLTFATCEKNDETARVDTVC